MTHRQRLISYRSGLAVTLLALTIAYAGVALFDDLLSSDPVYTWAFVSVTALMALCGAVIVGASFWQRNRLFGLGRR